MSPFAPLISKTVKFCALAVFASVIFLTGASAQERIVYDSRGNAHRVPPIDYKPPTQAGGIIPKALEINNPLVLINPVAPKKYGYGRGLVSWDGQAGKPKGFIFASVRFW